MESYKSIEEEVEERNNTSRAKMEEIIVSMASSMRVDAPEYSYDLFDYSMSTINPFLYRKKQT